MNKTNKETNVVYLTKRNTKVKSEAKINDAVRSMAFVIIGLFSVYNKAPNGALKINSNGNGYIELGCWRDRSLNYTFYDMKNDHIVNQNRKVPSDLIEQATNISFKFAYDIAYEKMKKTYSHMGVEFIDCAMVQFNKLLKIACLDCVDIDFEENKDNDDFVKFLMKCKVICNKDCFDYLDNKAGYVGKIEINKIMNQLVCSLEG